MADEKKNGAKPKEKEKVPKGYIVSDGGVYRATCKCTFGIRMYGPKKDGYKEQLQVEKGKLIPHHFVKVKGKAEPDEE